MKSNIYWDDYGNEALERTLEKDSSGDWLNVYAVQEILKPHTESSI